ncbi:hypothetical protein HDU79_000689 [Rhizoclosmatium sp. JEL0117]|nr:hypothetical protein HDU79_000689 [Rhizoclosmatium sp. JEL0117]
MIPANKLMASFFEKCKATSQVHVPRQLNAAEQLSLKRKQAFQFISKELGIPEKRPACRPYKQLLALKDKRRDLIKLYLEADTQFDVSEGYNLYKAEKDDENDEPMEPSAEGNSGGLENKGYHCTNQMIKQIYNNYCHIWDIAKQERFHNIVLENLAVLIADGMPLEYLIGLDEFEAHLFPQGAWKWEQKGAQHVESLVKRDKRQYTGDLVINAAAGATGLYQINDTHLHKPLKHFLKRCAMEWLFSNLKSFVTQMKRDIEEGMATELAESNKVAACNKLMSMHVLKNLAVKWMWEAAKHLVETKEDGVTPAGCATRAALKKAAALGAALAAAGEAAEEERLQVAAAAQAAVERQADGWAEVIVVAAAEKDYYESQVPKLKVRKTKGSKERISRIDQKKRIRPSREDDIERLSVASKKAKTKGEAGKRLAEKNKKEMLFEIERRGWKAAMNIVETERVKTPAAVAAVALQEEVQAQEQEPAQEERTDNEDEEGEDRVEDVEAVDDIAATETYDVDEESKEEEDSSDRDFTMTVYGRSKGAKSENRRNKDISHQKDCI